MIYTSSTELDARCFRGGQSKVTDGNAIPIVEAEDVFGLEVAVVDAHLVKVVDPIQELQKDHLDGMVVSQVIALVQDLVEQVLGPRILHDKVHELVILKDLVEVDDMGMARDVIVEGCFSNVSVPSAIRSTENLDSKSPPLPARFGCSLHRPIDDTVTAAAYKLHKLETVIVDQGPEGRMRSSRSELGHEELRLF